MDKLLYLGYVRKSSESDDRQAQSIETQTHILTEYASKYELNLIDIIHESRSAKDDGNRPMFGSLLARLSTSEANGIFVAHIDRLARNGIEAGQLVKLFQSGVIKEIKTPSKTYNTIQDLLYLDIEFAFAADYSRRLSLRVKEGIQTKLRRGEYPNQAPIGYFNKDGKIYPDAVSTSLVTELFEKYATGNYSLHQITKYINDRGLKSKFHHKALRKCVVHRILTDPVYYGVIRNKGEYYQGIHQPLISKSVFDTVQDVLSGKKKRGDTIHNFLYRDYLTCSVCGCKLTACIKKGRYIYYYCTNGKGMCNQHLEYLPESRIQQKLELLLTDFSLPEKMATVSLDEYLSDTKSQLHQSELMKHNLQSELDKLNEKLSKIEDSYFEGKLSEDRYEVRRKETQKSITDITIKLNGYKPIQYDQTTLELLEKIKYQAIHLGEMFHDGNPEVKKELLKSALWNCQIKDGVITSTRYKKPFVYFEGLSKCDDLTVWRRRRDLNSRIPYGIRFSEPSQLTTVPRLQILW